MRGGVERARRVPGSRGVPRVGGVLFAEGFGLRGAAGGAQAGLAGGVGGDLDQIGAAEVLEAQDAEDVVQNRS